AFLGGTDHSAIADDIVRCCYLIWFEGSGCDCLLVQAASLFDGLSFDGFPPFEYGRCCTEVDVGRRQVVQTLVVAAGVFVVVGPPPTPFMLSLLVRGFLLGPAFY